VSVLAEFLTGAVGVLLACPVAWYILSHWLFDRPLIIASVATATAANLGRFGYSGPPTIEALAALAGAVGAVLAGIVIAMLWLKRFAREVGE
jgi:hypothetical protein